MKLETCGLSLGYGVDHAVIRDLTLTIPEGKVTAILGPNGCGKSTLLQALARILPPQSGQVRLDGTDIHRHDTRMLARRLALLPQSPTAPDGITVGDLVRRGRIPWRKLFQPWGQDDSDACDAALQAVQMGDLAERPLDELSGGQRQRAWIALVLAQSPQILLLDEPTTFLDLTHQIEILGLLRARNRVIGMTVVSVLHDLNLAARFSDHLILLGPDRLVAQGSPGEVLTAPHLADALGLSAMILPDPVTGRPMVVPH